MRDLGIKLTELEYLGDPLGTWGCILAIDNLQHNPRAIKALLEVVDEMTFRPKFDELMKMSDRLATMRKEVRLLMQGRKQQQQRSAPTPGFRFTRRLPARKPFPPPTV